MSDTNYTTKTLSPKTFAHAIGVSESTMKRWVDAGLLGVSRTAGGHRRIPLKEAVRFIRERDMGVVRPDLLGIPELKQHPVLPSEALQADAFYEVLRTPHAAQTKALLIGAYLGGASLAELFDGPVREALERMGELWKHEDAGIFYERRATLHCVEAIHQILLFIEHDESAPAAVGAAPTGDPYALGSQMAAVVLADAGFRETNLGPDIPLPTLVEAVRETRAKLAWLSVSTASARDHLATSFAPFVNHLDDLGCTLVVGGRFAHEIKGEEPQKAYVVLASMRDLETFAREFRGNS